MMDLTEQRVQQRMSKIREGIFERMIPSALDREWSELSSGKQTAWAVLLCECPTCGVPYSFPCTQGGQVAGMGVHRLRLLEAEMFYNQRREADFDAVAARICPWCGLLCDTIADLSIHEEECD